jgi:hypothetical protein
MPSGRDGACPPTPFHIHNDTKDTRLNRLTTGKVPQKLFSASAVKTAWQAAISLAATARHEISISEL